MPFRLARPPIERRPLMAALTLAAAALSTLAEPAAAQFPDSDLFVSRPSRVAAAAPGQSADSPVAYRNWDLFETPPAAAPRDVTQLPADGEVALWTPIKNAETTTGRYNYYAEGLPTLDEATNRFTFDLYRLENQLTGDALTGPEERAYWIGVLAPGEYEFELRHWDLPQAPFGQIPPPWQETIGDAVFREADVWSFRVVVPEPATAAIAAASAAGLLLTRRRRGLR